MYEEKKKLRKELLQKRNAVDPVYKMIASREILSKISRMDEFQKADEILLYASYGSEVPTREIFETAVWMEKKVCFPKVIGTDMKFYEINHYEDLVDGYQGILEPEGKSPEFQDNPGKRVFMILPGCVFGRDGYRIGYGKGFYDRFLSTHTSVIKCGICYDLQLVNVCPHEDFDIKMDLVVTDREVIPT